MKLALYGVSGAGKSTVAAAAADAVTRRGYTVEIISLADPLYRLQSRIYATAGMPVGDRDHDNELLRTLATQLRRINPGFIVEDALRRVHATGADAVIIDDLRDTQVDHPRLAAEGFHFLHVSCSDDVRAARITARGDRTVVPDSTTHWGFDRISPDWTVDTTALDPVELGDQMEIICTKWLAQAEPPA